MNRKMNLDLDGVLADFDKKVFEIFGVTSAELPTKKMWSRLADPKLNFFDSLEWTPDGKELFEFARQFNPTIITGMPWGNWAEAQKRRWCARELGEDIKVITCMSKDKHTFADVGDILVDDREKARAEWVRVGGVFIHHTSAQNSIEQLTEFFSD